MEQTTVKVVMYENTSYKTDNEYFYKTQYQ